MINNPRNNDGRFSEHEQEIIKNFENARHLLDLKHHPGWKVFLDLKDLRLQQATEQFLTAKLDKDALWASQIRLHGIRDFIGALLEGIDNAVECLDPEAMKMILQATVPNPADLDGDLSLKEL
jgi:hypothetical protein